MGLGWIDFGARMYDGATGRWNGVDALAEAYQPWTTYGYTFNNPVRFIDPDGMSVFDPMRYDAPIVHDMFDSDKTGARGERAMPRWKSWHLAEGGPGDGQKKHSDGNAGHTDDRALDEVVITTDNPNDNPPLHLSSSYSDGPVMEPDGPAAAVYHALVQRTWYDPISGVTYAVDVLGYIEKPLPTYLTGEVPIGPGWTWKGLLGAARGSNFLKGGKTFSQFKASYWSGRAKPTLDPIINPNTGQVWKQYTELHHRFIPQRANWAPNWLKNNRLNLTPASSLRHAQMDPYRARFAPSWIKEMYNLKWK